MRADLLVALAALTSLGPIDERQRYFVVPTGDPADVAGSCPAAFSDDGRVVAFDALAALDPADTNGRVDVYVLDRESRVLTLVSKGLSGESGRGASRCPRISDDGQRIVFESSAGDLVEHAPHDTADAFLFDRTTGRLRRLSVLPDTRPATSGTPAISGDGRIVVFHASISDGARLERSQVYRISLDDDGRPEALGEGFDPVTSGDGRVVAYVTRPPGGGPSVIRVMHANGEHRVGHPAQGDADGDTYAPALSADGQWIAYVSRATTLVAGQRLSGQPQVYLERLTDGQRQLISATPQGREANGQAGAPSVDGTGRRVVFHSTATNIGCGSGDRPGCDTDINLLLDVFLWDRATGGVARVNTRTTSLPWLEGAGHAVISHDGRAIAFRSRQPVSAADDRATSDLFITAR